MKIRGSGDWRVARLTDSRVQGGGATADAGTVRGARPVPIIVIHRRWEEKGRRRRKRDGFGEVWRRSEFGNTSS